MYQRRKISRPRSVSPWIAWAVILGVAVVGAIVVFIVTRKPLSSGTQANREAISARDQFFEQLEKEVEAGTATPGQAAALERMKRVRAGEKLSDIRKEERAAGSKTAPIPRRRPSGP